VLTAAVRQLERLDELHAEHVFVPRHRLGHVAAHERKVIDAAQLELGVGVPGRGHVVLPVVRFIAHDAS
jgi:hypothetical protein